MADNFSAPGLRHIGYGIPSGLFGAFVVGCVEVVRTPADDRSAKESFRLLLSLISLMLMGVTNEAPRSPVRPSVGTLTSR